MKTFRKYWKMARNQDGAIAVIFAILATLLIGFTALALDIGHLAVVRNELQNAADAGALAGALTLFDGAGNINAGANVEAMNASLANESENMAVEVIYDPQVDNRGDVERGHWNPLTREFNRSDNLNPTSLWDVSTDVLWNDPNFINAVRVMTRREATPAASIFARIFGFDSFVSRAESVAFIGFAGQIAPHELDMPIAICSRSITTPDGTYSCNMGRMINSGQDPNTSNSGGWTNFQTSEEANQCGGAASNSTVNPLMDRCRDADGNPSTIMLGHYINTNGGMLADSYRDLMRCWWPQGTPAPREPWRLTLPVINCGDQNNVGTCSQVIGTVTIELAWMTPSGAKPAQDAPSYMEVTTSNQGVDTTTIYNYADANQCMAFKNQVNQRTVDALPNLPDGFRDPARWGTGYPNYTAGMARWDCFVQTFNLRNVLVNNTAQYAPFQDRAMYFLPSCDTHVPKGRTGGRNFGVLARYPALVQ